MTLRTKVPSSRRAPRFAANAEGSGQVAVGVLGDGGMAEGVIHESVNLVTLWKLPAVFFCENNHHVVTRPGSGSVAADPTGGLAGGRSPNEPAHVADA